MPIKLPKKFPRRKSSGPVLDEIETNPGESSFRVIERPKSGAKSFDGGNTWKRISAGRPSSTTRLEMEGNTFLGGSTANRGSGGTDISASTGKNNSSAASSMRLSAASTVPSSTDLPSDISSSTQWPLQNIPNPPAPRPRPRPGLRAGVRTMSFGLSPSPPPDTNFSRPKSAYEDAYMISNATRPRAMTTSTTSTATPPKLLDSDFTLNGVDLDGFGNMFEGIGKADNSTGSVHVRGERLQQRANLPTPMNVDRSNEVEPPPHSWTSQNSHDGLMSSSPPATRSTFNVLPRKPIPNPKGPVRGDSPVEQEDSGIGGRFKRSFAKFPTRKSTPNLREATKSTSPAPPEREQPSSSHSRPPFPNPETNPWDDEGLDFHHRQRHQGAKRILEDRSLTNSIADGSDEDQGFLAQANLAARYEHTEAPLPAAKPSNKVMTPEQFERYRHERESTQRLNAALKVTESDDEEEPEEDMEEDEVERNRQTAKQRQKQEAHLAVYRQQMMKVTGEQPLNDSGRSFSRPNLPSASSSTPNLTSRMSTLGVDPTPSPGGKSSEEEDDEDVPLGILAAHGFPNKNRPPTRLTNSGSNPDLRGSAASVAGGEGSRGNLPVFARHLPQDPYFGASLVNPSNRESLAMSGGMSVRGSTPPSTMPPGIAPPGLHPGGLVGVIAGEERAKAMRRGSPNGQAAYDPVTGGLPGMPGPNPHMVRSQTAGALPGMGQLYGMPGMPPMLTPGDQAQIQMSQQMQQMMQMQMQWMQQMMQMQGFQPGQSQPPMPGMDPSSMSQDPSQRPMSIHPNGPRSSGRTMSSLEPSMAKWDGASHLGPRGPNYATSIAPSERSNVGMASRYRPVSTVNSPSNARASTFTSGSFQPWSSRDSLLKGPPVPTVRPVAASKMGGSDDDDDQAWAEMKRKKDKKRSTWKNKKGQNQNSLHDLYPTGL